MKEHNKNWFLRHKILTAIGVIILLIIIGTAVGGGSSNNSNGNTGGGTANKSNASNSSSSVAKLNQPADDGKFEFTVQKVQCGVSEVVSPDSDALRKTAQGQYCILTMTVKNIGNEQQGFFADNQKILDAQSKQYTADDVATTYNSPSSQQNSWAQINPGNSVDATIVFDIPKNVTPVSAELHDSAFSGGVKVSLQ